MDRTDQVLHYLVCHCSGSPGRTRLAKLLFLVDLESVRYLKRRITDMDYVIDKFGPFDERFFSHKDHLLGAGVVAEKPRGEKEGFEYLPLGDPTPVMPDLTPAERRIVEDVGRRFGPMPRQELVDLVYALPLVRAAKEAGIGTKVDLERESGMGEAELGGLDLASVLEGEVAAERGDVVPAAKVESEIRARLRRDGTSGDPAASG